MSEKLSTDKRSELVERLFARLTVMYGNKFADMWRGIDLAEVKRCWADELASYTVPQVVYAVDKLKMSTFPPTLPEFLQMCEQGKQRLPYELEPRPRLASKLDMMSPETIAARERCMATIRSLRKPKPSPAWTYRSFARHQSGEHLLNPEELAIVNEAMRYDAGRNDPFASEVKAA